jgi:PAP2 superfamily
MRTDLGQMRAAATCLAIAGLFTALVLASGRVPLQSFQTLLTIYVQSMAVLTMFAGVIALFVVCGRRRLQDGVFPPPFALIRAYLEHRWQVDRLFSLVTPPLVAAFSLATFNAFKQLVLPSAGFGFDPLFAAWDRALFLGTDPWVLTHRLFGSLAATRAIDGFYHGWFVPMTLGIAVCAFIRDAQLRTQYLLAYALSWIVSGTLLAYLLPAAGPCYYSDFAGGAPTFTALMEGLRGHEEVLIAQGERGLSALRNQSALLNHFNSGHLAMGGGISAMPSMHNALAVLFALGGMRLNRRLGIAMWVYALMIWIGSIHLGWHYAIDGVAALVLTLGIWALSGRWARSLLRNEAAMPAALAAE